MRFYSRIVQKVNTYGPIESCGVNLILVGISSYFTRSSDQTVLICSARGPFYRKERVKHFACNINTIKTCFGVTNIY
jgi:hypothetical protein